jgi:uncharacterized cofD-like protein
MTQDYTLKKKPKIVSIGGGSGQPVILAGLKKYHADLTAVITVADDGGSSGTLRDYLNMAPPGDIRNVMAVLSNASQRSIDLFQYRFQADDEILSGHTLGNLMIAAAAEKDRDFFQAVQFLSDLMRVEGHVYPVSAEPLVLHAAFSDGTTLSGEAEITAAHKVIDHVWVTPEFDADGHEAEAPIEVVNAILNADVVVLGPGSLFTSVLPNLTVPNVAAALRATRAKVVYIANIMTQKGETDGYSDADHLAVINRHAGERVVDAVLMNTAVVPEDYIDFQKWNEVSHQVRLNPEDVSGEGATPVMADLLELRDDGAFHDSDRVAQIILQLAGAEPIEK